jgi:hypothetical protein
LGLEEILISSFVGFVLGIISAIGVKRWEIWYMQPKIEIQDIVVTKRFHLNDENEEKVSFWGNRIRAVNKGRSEANDCKVYVELENNIERVAWMLPDSTPAHSLTLNVNIPEYVDLCAIEACGVRRTRLLTTEYGYTKGTIKSCRPFNRPDRQVITVRVASSNTKPTKREVILRIAPIGDAQNPSRIVEFPKENPQPFVPQGLENI